jgi:peroxiredoxin
MSLTVSTMLELGTPIPDFDLFDVISGKRIKPADFKGQTGLLVIFLCKHCPYVIHVSTELPKLGKDYLPRGIGIVAISSNDPESHPEDGPENLRQMGKELGLNYPLCFDLTQEAAKAFKAACTPEFYLFDENRRLVYRGQLDDSRPGNDKPVDGHSLRQAMDAVLSGKPVDTCQKPGIGCNIKWRKGNEPGYFGR